MIANLILGFCIAWIFLSTTFALIVNRILDTDKKKLLFILPAWILFPVWFPISIILFVFRVYNLNQWIDFLCEAVSGDLFMKGGES